VRISKGQIIVLLNRDNAAFQAEKDAILDAGLATARWITVDDTGARHARTNQNTTHIGDNRFAYFATRPSKSRLNFLELLRAGRPDYVINPAAEAWMLEHKVPEAVIAALVGHEQHSFADDAAWEAHLASVDVGAHRHTITEAAVIGSITARGLFHDTVIVSDDAGQFNVFTHALCWVHAERHLRKLVCATEEQRRLVEVQRCLVWWYFRDLKLYKASPIPESRAALRQRFDRIFGRVTGFAELDDTVARLRAHKDELLLVLDRPEIPLHTNGSERGPSGNAEGGTSAAASPSARFPAKPAPKPASRPATPSCRCSRPAPNWPSPSGTISVPV
jgi:hypothetical protein